MKIFLTLATAAIIGIVAPAQAIEEIPAPAPVVQEITAIEHSEEIAPRDEIIVSETEIVVDAPIEEIAPGAGIFEPVTMDAEIVDTPAICEPGLILVEDGSCVDPSFFDEPEIGYVGAHFILEPCVHEDGSGQVACYWDAQERANGEGRSFVMLEGVFYYSE